MKRKNFQPNKMKKAKKNDLNTQSDLWFEERFVKATNRFKDFFDEKYVLGDIFDHPCPECGKRDSVRPFLSKSNGNTELRGFKCDSCGYESTLKEDLSCIISRIMFFTNKPTATNAKLATDLYDLFTEQMHFMNTYFWWKDNVNGKESQQKHN